MQNLTGGQGKGKLCVIETKLFIKLEISLIIADIKLKEFKERF